MWLNILTLFISIGLYITFSILTNPNDITVESVKHMFDI